MIDNKVYTLLKVHECGSFVAAAQQLNITQPAVSQHIKALEEELHITIFERGRGKLVLTKQGDEVIKSAKKMVGIYTGLLQDIHDGKSLTTHLTIGVTHTAESNPIAEALAGYCAKNPRVNIKMITDTISNLYTMLKTYEIDLAIVDGAYNDALYADTAALYRLDQTAAAQTGGAEPLGPLPGEAEALLAGLADAWLCMGAYAAGRAVKRRHAVKRQT